MEFPDDVLQLIRAFAKPRWTRRDWRSCKRNECLNIYHYHLFIRYVSNVVFINHALLPETDTWTLFGVSCLLFKLKFILGTVEYFDLLRLRRECTDWYIKRYRHFDYIPDIVSENILMTMNKPFHKN